MLPAAFLDDLAVIVGRDRVRLNSSLAPLTTFRVGGPAECLVETGRADEIVRLLGAARRADIEVTLIAGGSNTVVADRGVPGLVLRIHGGQIVVEQEPPAGAGPGTSRGPSAGGRVLVRADAGVTLNSLVRWTIGRGYAGLEAWAGTPGTVGGAVFGNAHYGGHHVSELLSSVRFIDIDGMTPTDAQADALDFSYGHSRFHERPGVILSAVFTLAAGADPARLRQEAHASLEHRKRTQPLNLPSAGCAFRNPDPSRDVLPPGMPPSAGALVDHAGLKGMRIGGASVSTVHANFIVSDGAATAADIRALVRLCQSEVERQFGVRLREEIRWIGSDEPGSRSLNPDS